MALVLSILPGACALAQAEADDSSWYPMRGVSALEPDSEVFAFDSSLLAPLQLTLDGIATALGLNPEIDNVLVTGFTDPMGSEVYNMALSWRRAEAVKDYLVSRGVDAGRIAAQGKGEASPVIQCTETDRAALIMCLEPNRRVEVDRITIERRAN